MKSKIVNVFDLLLTPLFLLEFSLFIVVLIFRKTKKSNALFCGLEHVIDKSAVRGMYLQEKGIIPYFYSLEMTGKRTRLPIKVFKTPKSLILDFIFFQFLVIKIRPIYMEVYFTGRMGSGLRQYYYSLVAKLSKVKVFTVLRGELFYYDEFSPLKKWFIKGTLDNSDKILYRETYMQPILKRLGFPAQKVIFDPNKVKVYPSVNFERNENIILFLNGFKKWRRIEIIIDAAPKVLKEHPDAKFYFIGARNENEKNRVETMLREKNIAEHCKVDFWTETPNIYYEKAKIFVLPADLVYLNFSLLEAMERGVPPIIAKVEDAEKIIQDGVEGYICEQTPEAFAEKINFLLQSEERRLNLAVAARRKIIEEFDDSKRMEIVLKELEITE
jgi:glycosyltransferase involved in cell wall biosynthesis